MSAFVQVERVTKRFDENTVLDEVSLNVAEHEVVCLIGASGSGKSTLLRCLNLLEKVQAGTITIDAAEANVVYARQLWPRSILQPPLTAGDRQVLSDIAEQEERRPEQHVESSYVDDGDRGG